MDKTIYNNIEEREDYDDDCTQYQVEAAESKPSIALSIDKMRHLMSLGVDCDNASMVYHPISSHSNILSLRVSNIKYQREFWNNEKRIAIVGESYFNRVYGRDVPAFTAEDIMMLLPETLEIDHKVHTLVVRKHYFSDESSFRAAYVFIDHGIPTSRLINPNWSSSSLVDTLYELLVWCIENNHINIKSEQ